MTDYLREQILPEELIDVPERTIIEKYRGELGVLAVQLSGYKGFPTYQYDIGAVHRDIYMDNAEIGLLNLQYNYKVRHVRISSIRLDSHLGCGVGSALYRSVLDLPLPSGEDPRNNNFILESTGQSLAARKVWARLVSENEAVQHSKTHFTMR